MAEKATSPRAVRKRKLTEKPRELLEFSEFVNGESDHDEDDGRDQSRKEAEDKRGEGEYEGSAASDAGDDDQEVVEKKQTPRGKKRLSTPHPHPAVSDGEESDCEVEKTTPPPPPSAPLVVPSTPRKKTMVATSANSRRKSMNDDLIEVLIIQDKNKNKVAKTKEKNGDDDDDGDESNGDGHGEQTLLDSPLKRMTVCDTPQTPKSPVKRKRLTRSVSPEDFEATSEEEGVEEDSFDLVCHKLKPTGKGKSVTTTMETPKKVLTTKAKPTEGNDAAFTTPKPVKKASPSKPVATRDAKKDPLASPKKDQASPKKKPVLCKKEPMEGEETAEDEGQQDGGSCSSSPRKKNVVVWSQDELNAIGEVYTAAMIAVPPNACREALQKVWERKNIPAKTNMELNNHLRKWKKTYQAIPSTFWA